MPPQAPAHLHLWILSFSELQSLLCPGDDITLRRPGEHIEECAVAGDPHDQVLVIFRMRLCVQQGGPVDHVILYMVTVQLVKEGADQDSVKE